MPARIFSGVIATLLNSVFSPLTGRGRKVAPSVAIAPLRAMAAGAAMPTGTQTLTSGVTMYRARTRHPILASSPTIQPRHPLVYLSGAAGAVEATISYPAGTTLKMSVEITTSTGGTASPTLNRLLFSGVNTYTAPSGGTIDPVIIPDELPASAFGLAQFSKGDVVYIQTEIVYPTAGSGVHCLSGGDGSGGANSGEACYYGGTGSVDIPGALAAQGGATQTGRIQKPLIVLGRHNGVAVMGGGDSITYGKSIVSNGDGVTAGSWMVVGAYQAGVPLTKIAWSGDRGSKFTPANRPVGFGLAAFHTHAILAFGTNDVGSDSVGSGMGSIIGASADGLHAVNSALKVWGVRIPLRTTTTSSDNWSTPNNQTVNPGWEAGGNRDLADQAVAALVGSKLAGVLDFNAAWADANNARFWYSDGSTAKLYTSDGTHPTQTADNAAAASVKPTLAGWTAS